MDEQSEIDREKANAAVREIYRPILRGYFAVFALYYLTMLPFNYTSLSGVDMVNMVVVSAFAAVIGLFGSWYMRKPAEPQRVELLLLVMNIMVVCNVLVALHIDFVPAKLTYFIIMAGLFALASINFRQSALSIALAIGALISFLPRLESGEFSAFAFLTFGSAMSSLAIAYFLRKSTTNIANAKIRAENRLHDSRQLAAEMRRQSLSDSLTQLPNRRAFFSTLRRVMREPDEAREQQNVWLILLDLDGFKSVNDIHGHLTGDLLLKDVASRLSEFAGDDIHVSRMGGDEFNLIYVGDDTEAEITDRCNELLEELSAEYKIEGRNIKISCSIGYKRMVSDESVKTQISQADYALMAAKKMGKKRATLFNEDHAQQAAARYMIEDALRQANLSEELNLVFQPQFDLSSETIICAEALLRWESPTIGHVEPQRFIKIAEESGLITGITLIVVEKAFEALSSWEKPIPISINLSSHDLISDPTIDHISALAKNHDIDPSLIEFEVTETAMMADIDRASANLHKLATIGYSIALDDFGTGYSNFNYLRALPIQKLKVDRSFIEDPGNPMTEKVLCSLTGMAKVLGMHCLLEGVENEFTLLMAKRAGAQSVQGYYFGRPMQPEDLQSLLETTQQSAA